MLGVVTLHDQVNCVFFIFACWVSLIISCIAGVLPLGAVVPDCNFPVWNWNGYREYCDKPQSVPVFPYHSKCLPPYKPRCVCPYFELGLTISLEEENWRGHASDG